MFPHHTSQCHQFVSSYDAVTPKPQYVVSSEEETNRRLEERLRKKAEREEQQVYCYSNLL